MIPVSLKTWYDVFDSPLYNDCRIGGNLYVMAFLKLRHLYLYIVHFSWSNSKSSHNSLLQSAYNMYIHLNVFMLIKRTVCLEIPYMPKRNGWVHTTISEKLIPKMLTRFWWLLNNNLRVWVRVGEYRRADANKKQFKSNFALIYHWLVFSDLIMVKCWFRRAKIIWSYHRRHFTIATALVHFRPHPRCVTHCK